MFSSKSKDKIEMLRARKGYVRWLSVRWCTLCVDDLVIEILVDLGLDLSRFLQSSIMTVILHWWHPPVQKCCSCAFSSIPSAVTNALLCQNRYAFSSWPHSGSLLYYPCVCFLLCNIPYAFSSCFRKCRSKQKAAAGLAHCLRKVGHN